ncbi:hypothetical protein ACFV9C_32675 [Kribbella sp. NPDC059898]|uniref:hypothetical protein n=1 Tax=Kribbella sp. NPDC059898 TaxID=3346995 RepID=UPI00365ACCDF
MIEITHTADNGTVARGVAQNDASAAIFGASWHWSPDLEAWRLPGEMNVSLAGATATELRRAGFDVEVQLDDGAERSETKYSMRWVGRQIERLETTLRKLDRQLDGHFRKLELGAEGSAMSELWSIRMLLRRTDLTEELRRWHEVSDQMSAGAPAHTPQTVHPGDYVRISGQWRKIARVNQKSVTVETGESRTGRAPYYDITGHRPADVPDGPSL